MNGPGIKRQRACRSALPPRRSATSCGAGRVSWVSSRALVLVLVRPVLVLVVVVLVLVLAVPVLVLVGLLSPAAVTPLGLFYAHVSFRRQLGSFASQFLAQSLRLWLWVGRR